MKILISAISCNPMLGSEPRVGWCSALALARHHDVWVLTRGHQRADIERFRAEHDVPESLHFVYHGTFSGWHPNMMIARLQSWRDYSRWSRSMLPVAAELHRRVGFDLVHHVTLVAWRVASPLWKLGVPLVWGPIGGAEKMPLSMYPILNPKTRAYELLRSFSNFISARSPSVRHCARRAAHVFASNPDAKRLLTRLRGREEGISRLLATFFSKEDFARFASGAVKSLQGPLKIFAGGVLEGRKGVALAIHALARACAEGVDFTYVLGGYGPELEHLRELTRSLAIEDRVQFTPGFSGEEYVGTLNETHVYLLPSLRDNGPVTLMEAMLAGCVPVVADCGGPGEIVSESTGIKVAVRTPAQMISDLTRALIRLDRDRSLIHRLGQAASERIQSCYSEKNYVERVNAVYSNCQRKLPNQRQS